MRIRLRQLLALFIGGLLAAVASAQNKPFDATASSTDGSNITVRATGSNLTDFYDSLLNTNAAFQALDNHPYNASSTFLGVSNAITFTTNSTGTAVTMGLTPIGFTKTFTGTSSDDVNNQVDDFFQKNGVDIYSRFLKAIAEQSVVAVTDGNPNAATAIAARDVFMTQGFTSSEEIAAGAEGGTTKPKFGGFGLGFNAGQFTAAGFKGTNYDFSLTGFNIGFGDRVRLVTPVSLSYLKLDDAQVAGFGVGLALPIRFKVMDATERMNWRLTPTAGVSLRGSADLASGALIWQAGLTNTIDYKVSPTLVLCLVNQMSQHQSISVSYGDYEFDPQINQTILKNGVRAVMPLNRRWIADLFVVETNFLKTAAVKNFTTLGGSLSLRASQSFNLSLGANYDTGTAFKAWSVGLSSAWHW